MCVNRKSVWLAEVVDGLVKGKRGGPRGDAIFFKPRLLLYMTGGSCVLASPGQECMGSGDRACRVGVLRRGEKEKGRAPFR